MCILRTGRSSDLVHSVVGLATNLHAMGGICKKLWLWDILVNFSFGCLQNLTPDTYRWMLEHSSHCDVVVTENDTNDEKLIIECILYHLQYSRIIHTFWASLEVLWALMFFCLFSSIFFGITLPAGLGKEYHSNDPHCLFHRWWRHVRWGSHISYQIISSAIPCHMSR